MAPPRRRRARSRSSPIGGPFSEPCTNPASKMFSGEQNPAILLFVRTRAKSRAMTATLHAPGVQRIGRWATGARRTARWRCARLCSRQLDAVGAGSTDASSVATLRTRPEKPVAGRPGVAIARHSRAAQRRAPSTTLRVVPLPRFAHATRGRRGGGGFLPCASAGGRGTMRSMVEGASGLGRTRWQLHRIENAHASP